MRKEKFTPADHDAVAAHYSSMRKKFFVVVAVQMLMLTGVSVGLTLSDIENWYLFIGAFLLTDILALYLISRKWSKAKHDLEERMKVSGTFRIEDKSRTKNAYSLTINNESERRIQVERQVYNRITAGEDLYVEFAEHCGLLLGLKRGDEVIYSASKQQERQTSL